MGKRRLVDTDLPTHLPKGARPIIGSAHQGMRFSLPVRGGSRAPLVLGCRSRDVRASLSPAPPGSGDLLAIVAEPATPVPAVDFLRKREPPDGVVALHVSAGPQSSWFTDNAIAHLHEAACAVSARPNRTGIRLEKPVLERFEFRELPSEAMIAGSIQVHPNGAPTIMAVDAPTTGGYPIIAVLAHRSVDALAQVRPGQLDLLVLERRQP